MSQEKAVTHNRFTKWAVRLAIVIVLNLFFNYAVSLAYPEPQYEDFVKPSQVVSQITSKDQCLSVGGQ